METYKVPYNFLDVRSYLIDPANPLKEIIVKPVASLESGSPHEQYQNYKIIENQLILEQLIPWHEGGQDPNRLWEIALAWPEENYGNSVYKSHAQNHNVPKDFLSAVQGL